MHAVESLSVELHKDPARELGSIAVFNLLPEHAASMTEQSFYDNADTVNEQADPFLARRARPEYTSILSGDVELVDFEIDFETLVPIRAKYRVLTAADVIKIQSILTPTEEKSEVERKSEKFSRLYRAQQAAARRDREAIQLQRQVYQRQGRLRRVASGVAARIHQLYQK